MPLFNRGKRNQEAAADGADPTAETKKEKGGWRRPANTAFKQQRLKAWQPILTPKTVLPTLFIIGILFAPIGGLLVWGSSLVSELTLDYTNCDQLNAQTPTTTPTSLTFTNMPSYNYRLRAKDAHIAYSLPQYAFMNDSTSDLPQCVVKFQVPAQMDNTVLLYYKLTNFYQNHRRYVKSLDSNQLLGKHVDASTLNNGDCTPLALRRTDPNDPNTNKIVYPCGLIANSMFNDTFSELTNTASAATYNFSSTGIAWPGEAKKYSTTPSSEYNYTDIVPPPNWAKKYPNYNSSLTYPDLKNDEHFQNWMRTSGLPTFSKLYGRNDGQALEAGTYTMIVDMNFPVRPYKGTKSIVISTVSWIGGKNPFLGWAYVAAAAIFILLAVAGTARHLIRPRRLGDMSLLSWNQQ
ncbi:cell cycle control protein [Athelia psychrophila]|uniref:Cell cycle control protein n=1 Tax=Athelia psychrophila TaxID=1759441 RepID=A0A166SVC0_9AGAM|nr:cell cycle control protein [Fibularhizoctonia sp. CBS 109695]